MNFFTNLGYDYIIPFIKAETYYTNPISAGFLVTVNHETDCM